MKPIVLATDGSPSAAEATLQAIELAHALATELVAVSVEHVTITGAGYYGYSEVYAELSKTESDHVDATLEQARGASSEAGIACETVHATGPVADAICSVARKHNAQMIVIGAHGWGPINRVLHGSISTAVVHQAPCPVLVVPAGPELVTDSVPADRMSAVS